MNLLLQGLIFLLGIYFCDGGYGVAAPSSLENDPQNDVQAPAYLPPNLKNAPEDAYPSVPMDRSYRYMKNRYSGTKTGYGGTKTGYSGTKTSYSGTKTGHYGTKTGYTGTKSGYSGTKSGYSNSYGEKKTWYSNNNAPTYEEFYGNANEPYKAKCDPDCKNSGICIDTNTCQCPANFHGRYCEFERKPCLVYPPLPMNSRRNCSNDFCTVHCQEGHKFIDGSTIANMQCVDGQWKPTRADFTTIPDCLPECDPPCQNGGVCLSLNTCQCPEGFRGPACQYSASVCDMRKLAFNGGYSCFGDDESFSCKLRCPSGSTFSSSPAALYSCKYSTGVFEPQPVPHCVFKDVMVITPSNYVNRTYESSTSWNSSSSSSSHSYGYGMSEHSEGRYSGGSSGSYGGGISGSYGGGSSGSYGGGSSGSSMTVVIQDLTPKGGTCLTWAGVHYKTFDGKIYSFQSPCQHILVRDAVDHKYTVAVRHGDCRDKAFCPSELTVYLEDKPYILAVGEDGTVAFRSTKRLIPMPASLPGIRVAMPGDYVLVNLDAAGVTIKWDTENLVLVEGTVQLWNATEGLCGRLDGNPGDDLVTRDGAPVVTNTALASQWQLNKIGDICESSPTEVNACSSKSDEDMKKALQFCTKIFSKDKFRKCSKVMDVSMLLETCQWDYCACATTLSPEECACRTVSVYAKECLRHGVEEMKAWRDEDTCPVKCPEGKIYKACGPDSQPSCSLPQLTGKVDNATCSEGCFCPEGLLLEGGRCVPRAECPCRLRNRSFKPGQTIKKECNTCTCQSGEWTCTQVACGARCSAVGDPHYTTFDGLRYDFMGHCTYNLLKSDNFTVEVENVACSGAITEAMNLAPYKGEGKPSCTKAVSVSFEGADIHLKQGGFILVNGKEVTSLPVTVGKVRIRAASSLFVIVQLPIKVDVWWDGQTRVFVDVPPALQGKTQGLCGTFNLNQKDDFLTPEGDVEQSTLAFANKWKTRELCDDVMATEPEHPCKANVENKEAAEKYCSRLKTSLFAECHWYVDVEPYYEACLYDMCACAGDVSRCLCPVIGDYAMACAQNGVKVQWRYNVKECELQCAGGQEYTVCADSCLRQCTDIALVASGNDCKPCCVEGCACPPGQLLDDSGVCVPVGLCPCYHKGMKFDAEYKEVRPGRRERELCTCVGGLWECVPATPADIAKYPPAEDLRSNCSATKNMEFTTCEIAEPLTCKNMHLPPSRTSEECRPGCQCKKGFVLDTSSKQCVLASQCPCHHGGRSYPDGHKMQEECNTCECKSGNWTCSERKCAGVCTAWGDSHVVTFDGADYDFEGVCTYLLAKGSMDADDGFVVEIQNVPCGTTGATCSKSVVLKVGTPGNEEVVSLIRNTPLPNTSKLKRIKLRLAGAYVFLDVPSLGVSLQWDKELRVYVKVDSLWQGRVKGLCGNYNADTRDDFQAPSGGGMAESSPLIFADSWKLKSTCPKPQPVGDHCKQRPERNEWATTTCGALKRFPFSLCHSEVPADKWVQRCERDACACDAGGDCACACAALAAYAHACTVRGVTFKWRTPELCPMQCDEECSNYDACVSPCPLETCDNTIHYAELNTQCGHDACVEGCKPKKSCPEGSVYTNSSFSKCVPRAQCKPVCMILDDGTEIPEGGVIEEDACHSCTCSKKHKVCTGQPCSTMAPTTTPPVASSPKPHDEPLKCVSGWTEWVSRNTPEVNAKGQSVDLEPLPEPKDLQIGSPMCKPNKMTKIECRTKVNHQTPKETGLDVECSLERGLVCRETGDTCPDFQIRVYCECEEEFQCLNSEHPSYPHPKNCAQFYECTPDLLNPDKPHTVLKNCAEGTLYNPKTMVCDWPSSVFEVRPECDNVTELGTTPFSELGTTPQTYRDTTAGNFETYPPTALPTTVGPCGPGRVFKPCAYPCDRLCDHFHKTLNDKGLCKPGAKCADECVEESLKDEECGEGLMWRDEETCVPVKDCTCYSEGKIIKPGGVITSDCMKCQCLNNDLHCDTSDCLLPTAPSHERLIESTTTETTTTEATTTAKATTASVPVTTNTPLIIVSTTSPPPECSPDSYKNLLWGDEPLSDAAFTASSISNDFFKPQNAILDGTTTDVSAGSWTPETMDQHQYIQVEFPRPEPIYGVVLQGSPIFDQYVTSYELMYGDDGVVFSKVNDADGKPKVFRGPVDHKKPMKQMIEPPIEAKFLRLRPLTWHKDIAVRFEVIGCQEPKTTEVTTTTTPSPIQCTEPLGLAADLPIENIEVSSNNDDRRYFQLDAARGWRPAYSTPGEWIMFDFTAPRNLTGIKTKGGPKGWVTAYNVMYTSDLSTFNPVVDSDGSYKVFPANFDSETVVSNEFRLPIHARYLKVLPLKWKDAIEMRIEPIGCFEPYPVTTTVAPAVTSAAPCSLCPGVPAPVTSQACSCSAPQHYDGENCVPRDQCPCVEGFMSYSVGSTFRGSNCDECVCKLGGVTDCRPVKECLCAPDLVPKLSQSTCECLCSPCPNTTRICPTSKLCLPLEKWCDGLQDCPDDELGCTTTTTVTIEPTVITTVAPSVAAIVSTTTAAVTVTTAKPVECPPVECPPGYMVRYTTTQSVYTSDLPPPRPRYSYQRYFRGGGGGYSKGGYSKGGYSKGGYSKGGFSKGGYGQPTAMPQTNSFTLVKPTTTNNSQQAVCPQFKCVPKLPPPPKPGHPPPVPVCATPACPPRYSLKLEGISDDQCPQYVCVPPVERPVWCNVTGRTFNTFDGAEYKYDVCFHILARDNKFDAWSVLVRKKCRVEGCQNELIVHQDDQLIVVKPNLMIEYDNYEYTVEQTSKICFQKNSFDVDKLGNGLAIKSRKYNFTVLYSTDGDVKIGVPTKYKGSVDGMCGAYDGDTRNDRRMPDGRLATSVDQFGRAWARPGLPPNACQTKVVTEEKQKRAWKLCDVITHEPFSKCGKVLNLDKWRTICLEKICECEELVVNGTRRTSEECRCLLLETLVGECLAADRDVDLGGWRMMMDCPADCAPPLVHYDCYRKRCEPSCSTLGPKSCPAEDGQCFPGCYCPEGTLRKGDQCIAPADCLDCTCKGAGEPASYNTFEGDEFPFLGNCTYLASRDRNDTGQHKYQVYATNGPCEGKPDVTCTEAVHVIYEKNVIHVTKDLTTEKLQLSLGDTAVFKFPVTKEWMTADLVNKQDLTIMLTDVHVQVTVQQSEMEFSVRLPTHLYSNRTEGLCGVCGGTEPVLITRNGSITDDVDEFGSSWQASPAALATLAIPSQAKCGAPPPPPACAPPPPDSNPCYTLFNPDVFGACHALVDPQSYVESCTSDICALNATDSCDTQRRYARACAALGVCVRWRGDHCPYTCSSPLVYNPCMKCERTCDNYEELKQKPETCDQPFVEGCYCPEGQVRVNNTCIEASKCFPCDAKKEHYAGDEWQEDACTKCTCSKLSRENAAHVSCTIQTCTTPVCSNDENLVTKHSDGTQCCKEYMCVPKPNDNPVCDEPKKIVCGAGQVLKQKTTPNGCQEFACECKPASECERLPNENEVEIMEAGMERIIDRSGCCPTVQMVCRKETCPEKPDCPKFHTLKTSDVGKCCPEYKCEIPKDKCIVNLEWEAAPRGGEKARDVPEVVLKDIDSVWLDGPCRTCRCASSGQAAVPSCAVAACSAPATDTQFVWEPRAVPFACCTRHVHVACRHGDDIYRVGENWTSPYNPCESYRCEQLEDGKLDKVTTVKHCDEDCQLGSKYIPAEPNSKQCCGKCKPVACVVDGKERPVGDHWVSEDFCTNYTCVDVDGTLQVQSSDEICPETSDAIRKQFVLKEEKIPGKCCPVSEPVACRVGNEIYQEGQSYPTSDPCKNITCARDESNKLAHIGHVQSCDKRCLRGWAYRGPGEGECCGRCEQAQCVLGEELKSPGDTWYSADNCTTFTCERLGHELQVSAARPACPDVSGCAPADVVNDTCCQRCVERPQALSTCVAEPVRTSETIRMVRVHLGPHGLCVNREPIKGLNECKGYCDSGTTFSNATSSHTSSCSCCQAVRYAPLTVDLTCEDGTRQQHRLAVPEQCSCKGCGESNVLPGTKTGPENTKNGHYGRGRGDIYDYEIPEIYQRFGSPKPPRR